MDRQDLLAPWESEGLKEKLEFSALPAHSDHQASEAHQDHLELLACLETKARSVLQDPEDPQA